MGVFTNNITKRGSVEANKNFAYYFKRIGVSVLFSGAAVGVSHVVQATRAGADFSLALLPLIVLCLFLKYPAFLFGPLYTSVTGKSVVTGYRNIGRWTLPVVGISFVCVMATVVAAVAMLASSIFIEMFKLQFDVIGGAIGLALICTIVSLYSSFSRFQESMKIVFFLLVAISGAALALAIPSVSTETFSVALDIGSITNQDIFFIAALVGWMPAGLDLPMMHSQWLLASKNNLEGVIEDFNFGYLSTAFLAVLFVVIGAVFFFGAEISIESSAGGFAKQLLTAYSNSLGLVGGLMIGLTFFLAIFSSLIVVIDGFPRVLSEVISVRNDSDGGSTEEGAVRYRRTCAWIQFGGATIILLAFSSSLISLVDFATITSFLLGPLFAILNHKLLFLPEFTQRETISKRNRYWSLAGITFFVGFAVYYIFIRAF